MMFKTLLFVGFCVVALAQEEKNPPEEGPKRVARQAPSMGGGQNFPGMPNMPNDMGAMGMLGAASMAVDAGLNTAATMKDAMMGARHRRNTGRAAHEPTPFQQPPESEMPRQPPMAL